MRYFYRNTRKPLRATAFMLLVFLSCGVSGRDMIDYRRMYLDRLDEIADDAAGQINGVLDTYRRDINNLVIQARRDENAGRERLFLAELNRFDNARTLPDPQSRSSQINDIADRSRQLIDEVKIAEARRIHELARNYDRALKELHARLEREGDEYAVREIAAERDVLKRTGVLDQPMTETSATSIPVSTGEQVQRDSIDDWQIRTWRDTSGDTIDAALVEVSAGFASLRKRDGEILRIRLNSLSHEDQVFIGAHGRGPVTGENWISPSTGMEFIWDRQLRVWIGKHEVTNAEYRLKVPGHDSGEFGGHGLNGDRQPVVMVNFSDAVAYAEWLTGREQAAGRLPQGIKYRLPTGEEWLTFSRSGRTRFPWGDQWPPPSGRSGNYSDSIIGYSSGHPVTAPVDELWLNPRGLSGAGGNVWEMTTKTAGGDFDAWRGGSWRPSSMASLQCSYRSPREGSVRDDSGFRLLLSR